MDMEKRIENEKTKLEGIFAGLDDKRLGTVKSLIGNAAFMTVILEDLRDKISEDGVTSRYQNGNNQWGTKKSPEVEVYLSMIKNYITVIKTLCDMLPEKSSEASALLDWAKRKEFA